MTTRLMVIAVIFLLSGCVHTADSPVSAEAPDWYRAEIATLTAGDGRWVTDNSAYKSEQETFDAYVTEWVASFDGTVMSGRLFGRSNGKDSGNFWEFKQYWHPQRKVAVIEQFGWGGVVGIGTQWREGITTKSSQTFFAADGTATRTGHISSFPTRDTHATESFTIAGDTWKPDRKYIWKRVR